MKASAIYTHTQCLNIGAWRAANAVLLRAQCTGPYTIGETHLGLHRERERGYREEEAKKSNNARFNAGLPPSTEQLTARWRTRRDGKNVDMFFPNPVGQRRRRCTMVCG